MNFGQAIDSLKSGNRVSRAGWNGKGMFLVLVEADDWTLHGHPTHLIGEVPPIKRLPWIGMKTAGSGFVPWLASQTDILAEDWDNLPR